MKKLVLIALLVVCALLAGCAGSTSSVPGQQTAVQDSPKTTAYKTLATANKTYTTTMKALGDLYRQGLIDEKTKAKAIELGKAFQKSQDIAITQVEAGNYNSVAGVSQALANLLDFVQPLLIKGGKVK